MAKIDHSLYAPLNILYYIITPFVRVYFSNVKYS